MSKENSSDSKAEFQKQINWKQMFSHQRASLNAWPISSQVTPQCVIFLRLHFLACGINGYMHKGNVSGVLDQFMCNWGWADYITSPALSCDHAQFVWRQTQLKNYHYYYLRYSHLGFLSFYFKPWLFVSAQPLYSKTGFYKTFLKPLKIEVLLKLL